MSDTEGKYDSLQDLWPPEYKSSPGLGVFGFYPYVSVTELVKSK
jgi:hypothetical protein